MSAGLHAFVIALIFLATAVGLLIYKRVNPDNRTDLVKLGMYRCMWCAAAFTVSGLAKMAALESHRLQVLTLAPVNLAIIFIISAICTSQARSYGTVDISPKARSILRHSKRAFILTFGASISLSLIWPVPVQEDFQPAPAIFLLERALVTFPEMVFPAVATFVSFQAARAQEPVKRIRLQQGCLCVSHAFIAMIGLSTFSAVCFRVFVKDEALRRGLIEYSHVADGVILGTISASYILGLCLYYVGDQRAHAITRFNRWRRVRGYWENQLRRLDDKTLTEAFPEYANIDYAAWELAERSIQEGHETTFVYQDIRKAHLTFKLLNLVSSPASGLYKDKDSELLTLIKYHERLLREPSTKDISWQITNASSGEAYFDLRTDSLLEVAKRVREFLHTSSSNIQLVNQPQWFQLALLSAAKAGILQAHPAAQITERKAVMDRVARACDNAGIRRKLYKRPMNLLIARP